jgi:hypothetical protein
VLGVEVEVWTPKDPIGHDPSLVGIVKPRSSAKRLLLALLTESIADAERRNAKGEQLDRQMDARSWLFGEPDPSRRRWRFGDFEDVCSVLGIDPGTIRKSVRRAISGEGSTHHRPPRVVGDRGRTRAG